MRGFSLVNEESDDAPRRRITEPEPRLPESETMSRPAIRPCKASSTVVIAKPSNSSILMVWWAFATSRSGICSELPSMRLVAETVTSLIVCASADILTLNSVLSISKVCVVIPRNWKRNLSFGLIIFMVKLPFISDCVPEMTRPLASTSQTVAPIRGPNSSSMVPCTEVIFPCAKAFTLNSHNRQQVIRIRSILINVFICLSRC